MGRGEGKQESGGAASRCTPSARDLFYGARHRRENGQLIFDGSERPEDVVNGLEECAKKAIPVQATPVAERTEVKVSWQESPLVAEAGDLIVTDGQSIWPVGRAIFAATYEAQDDGILIKRATVRARQIDTPFVVETREGRALAEAGDWLVQGAAGEAWPIKRENFAATYRPVGEPAAA